MISERAADRRGSVEYHRTFSSGVVIFCVPLQVVTVPIFLKVRHMARAGLNGSPERA